MAEDYAGKIEDLLRKRQQGLTNTEIRNYLKISPYIIAIELAKLEGAGKLKVRKVGKARLNYWG